MYNIRELRLESVEKSEWIRIKQVRYKQNGIKKSQEVTCSHDSCGILIHNRSRDAFIFVRQFRPAVFMHSNGWKKLKLNSKECVDLPEEVLTKGFTLELCAGILDKADRSVPETAADEVLEECGYRISPGDLEPVLTTRNNSLHSGTLQHLFYAEVTDDMMVEGSGGGIAEEGEFIDVVEVKVADALGSLFDEDDLPKPIGLTFALVWYLFTKTGSNDFRLACSNGHQGSPSTPLAVEKRKRTLSKEEEGEEKNGERKKRQKRDFRSEEEEEEEEEEEKPKREDRSRCVGGGLEVTDVSVADKRKSGELQIYRLYFRHADSARAWDFFRVRSTCSVLVHDVDKDVFLLVRRFSPAIYASLDRCRRHREGEEKAGPVLPSSACLNQLCSTSYDDGVEPCRSASGCVRDTFGYEVPMGDFKKIIQARSNVGIAGALMTLFYVRITSNMKLWDSERKPADSDRDYDVVEVPVSSSSSSSSLEGDVTDGLEMLMLQGKNPMSLSLALLWYYYQNPVKSQ